MHRIDTPDALAGLFAEVLPNFPTQVDIPWLNAIQEEIAKTIEGAGLTLRASGAADEGASYSSQLLEAIKRLIGRARAHIQWDGSGGVTLVNGHGVTAVSLGGDKVVITLSSPFAAPGGGQAAQVTVLRTGTGSAPAVSAGDVTATGSNVEITLRLSDGSVFNPLSTPGSMTVTLPY